jgi:tetratricopeptide (TPR) repeat protein
MIVFLAACATTPESGPAKEPVAHAATGNGPEAAPDAPGGVAAENMTPAAAPAGSPGAGKEALSAVDSIWRDPNFQRQFLQSYLAETEIEPGLDPGEFPDMEEVLELTSADQLDEAVELLQDLQGESASAAFDFTLANIYIQRDQLDDAVSALEIAVDKYPKFRRAWQNLGLSYFRQGQFAKAIHALSRVLELGGASSITYGMLGFSYSSIGNSLAAETAYRMAILLDPVTLEWKKGLALSLFRQSRYADAAALFQTLIEQNPGRADLWLLQADAYARMDEPLRAAENLEFVDELGESTVDSLNLLGDIYTNEELFDLAVDSYVRALDRDPEAGPDRALRAAKVLTARGGLEETRRLVEHIESRSAGLDDETRKEVLRLRALLAEASGDAGAEEAQVLEEIIALDPLDGEALIRLGKYYRRSGELEKAEFYFLRASELERFEADAKLAHAQLLVGQGKYGEALPLLRRSQQLDPRENVEAYLEQVERLAQSK